MHPVVHQRARAVVDLAALRHNYNLAAGLCPAALLAPVVKANGYGHGAAAVARALVSDADEAPAATAEVPAASADSSKRLTALPVATVDESMALVGMELGVPAMLLGGCINREELEACLQAGVEVVVHSEHQIADLKAVLGGGGKKGLLCRRLWLKMNSGMNRLGLPPQHLESAYAELQSLLGARGEAFQIVLMSHLACADEGSDNPAVQGQLQCFAEMYEGLGGGSAEAKVGAKGAAKGAEAKATSATMQASLAASAGIMGLGAAAGYDIVRPGIMLYGGSPLQGRSAAELGLRPVMSLRSRLIAVNQVAEGEAIGYGAVYTCTEETRVGVASIGYADGYPRSAPTGTPIGVVSGGKMHRSRLLGRVSMDLITIDLNGLPEAGVGDEVILWGGADGGEGGESIDVDEVAGLAGTIAYELFCRVGRRVEFEYRGG